MLLFKIFNISFLNFLKEKKFFKKSTPIEKTKFLGLTLLENSDKFRKQIRQVRSKTVFNIGESAVVGAKHIAKIADESKAINKF